ncbi:MAG: hypothetical protein IT445_20280 [Phycisphaeraceae bacterium]|nr:hypothetical protein [Phycisphaeraceae bacterium]
MPDPWPTWFAAAVRPDVDAALRDFYGQLDAVIAARRPVCNQSGRCCNFDAFGHKLYVTALEIAWFIRMADRKWQMADGQDNPPPDTRLPVLSIKNPQSKIKHLPTCPYQINNLCTAHAIRPMGCRVFFCQQGTQDWQQQTYERFLTQLIALHQRFALPYLYLEWRSGLDEALAARDCFSPSPRP